MKNEKDNGNNLYTLPNAYDDIKDFPQSTFTDKYVLVEDRGTEQESYLCFEESFKEAYKVYKKIGHKDKSIVLGDVFYCEICGVQIIQGFKEKELVL